MLDPSVGEGVVQAMQKEVHRMELRLAELLRLQERLMQVRAGAGEQEARGRLSGVWRQGSDGTGQWPKVPSATRHPAPRSPTALLPSTRSWSARCQSTRSSA
jgi:hypothetical protein